MSETGIESSRDQEIFFTILDPLNDKNLPSNLVAEWLSGDDGDLLDNTLVGVEIQR